jgi:hypothetical protein
MVYKKNKNEDFDFNKIATPNIQNEYSLDISFKKLKN